MIIASKMLFLSESVRDVIDIKLSKKFNTPVNIVGKKHNTHTANPVLKLVCRYAMYGCLPPTHKRP